MLAMFAVHRTLSTSAWIPVDGSSMNPLVQPGDEVCVEFGIDRSPPLGAIVVFREDELMVVHRLVWKRSRGVEEMLVTRGDGRIRFDRPFPVDDLFGVVRACRRGHHENQVAVASAGLPATLVGLGSLAAGTAVAVAERIPGAPGRAGCRATRRLATPALALLARCAARLELRRNPS